MTKGSEELLISNIMCTKKNIPFFGHHRINPDIQLDSNICYFAIQCLGKLALLDRGLFMDCLDTFPLLKAAECVLARGKYTSLCLHILRLFRTIGE